MSSSRNTSIPQRGGITVRTRVQKVPSNQTNNHSNSSSQSGLPALPVTSTSSSSSAPKRITKSSPSKPSRTSKPSKRYRSIRKNTATGHGGEFIKDDDIARQFANRILEVYAPSTDNFAESRKTLSLSTQARRDGESFQLPKLGAMCLNVISNSFDSHILPLRYTLENSLAEGNGVKDFPTKSTRGLFGIEVGGYNEEEDKDFMPDDDDDDGESRPSKRTKLMSSKRIARKSENKSIRDSNRLSEQVKEQNAQLLELLPTRLTLALQERLERKAPQALSFEVLSKFFLSSEKVSDSKSFRVLAIIKGVNEKSVVKLWQELIYQKSLTPIPSSIRTVMPDNAISSLRILHLQAFTRLSTREILNLFEHTRSLESVCLRGCVNLYPEAVAKLVEMCGQTLKKVNFNWTSIGLSGVEHLIGHAPNLEMLKIAHVRDLTDSSVSLMMNRIAQKAIGSVPLGKLHHLKLNGTDIGIQGLAALLKHCGTQLKSLDIGNTRVGGSGCMEILLMLFGCDAKELTKDEFYYSFDSTKKINTSLEKINLSHLQIPTDKLDHFLRAIAVFKKLRKINLDHIKPPSGGISDGLNTADLRMMFDAIAIRAWERSQKGIDYCPEEEYLIDNISAARNSATSSNVLLVAFKVFDFVSISKQSFNNKNKIIRSLNLSGRGIIGTKEDEVNLDVLNSPIFNLQHLNLSGCTLQSNTPWGLFGVNGGLRTIDLSKTNVDRESVDDLIQNNPFLELMNLTGCRSIPVSKRRNYLEYME